MNALWQLADSLLIAGELVLLAPVVYLCAISLAAIRAQRKLRRQPQHDCCCSAACHRFAVFVPAHNEEAVIAGLLESLAQLNYPKDLYQVYVIADNCTDRTAEVARRFVSVEALERRDPQFRGKGYALDWAWQKLAQRGLAYDAYVIIDADSIASADFLLAMCHELSRGAAHCNRKTWF